MRAAHLTLVCVLGDPAPADAGEAFSPGQTASGVGHSVHSYQ